MNQTTYSWAALATEAGQAGPIEGLEYASPLRRLAAYIIDSLILGVTTSLLTAPLQMTMTVMPDPDWIYQVRENPLVWIAEFFSDPALVAISLLGLAASGAYFILTWRLMRGSPGQRVLGVYLGNAADGRPLSWSRATIRWLLLTLGPLAVVGYLLPTPWNLIFTVLVGIGSWAWILVLLVTVVADPRRQGWHDRWSGSLAVRRP